MLQCLKRTHKYQVSNNTEPNHVETLFKTVVKSCVKTWQEISSQVSVLFEKSIPKERFEYWTLLERFLWDEISNKQFVLFSNIIFQCIYIYFQNFVYKQTELANIVEIA